MGNDGGSIPKRRELVKSAARTPTVSELKATALESLGHAWAHDALTSQPLEMESAVSDWRGRLYNYETILENLLPRDGDDSKEDSTTAPSASNGESQELTFAATGIKSLRDVVKLKFKRYSPPGEKGKEIWACPISQKELGPATKTVYLVPCGHVFAEVGIRTIQENACPECSEPFSQDNVIDLLPTDPADIEKLTERRDSLIAKGLAHSLKKDKSGGKNNKRKAGHLKSDAAQSKKSESTEDAPRGVSKPSKGNIDSRVSRINNPATASLTAKVLAEQDAQNKRRKLAMAAR